MNRRLFGAFGVLTIVAISFGSCKSDPLSELDGSPAAIVVNFDLVRVAVGDTASVTATVLDGRSTPLAVPITFRTCSAVATTVIDPEYHPVPATSARALIIGASLGTTCVIASGEGFEDTTDVLTFPATLEITGGPANDSIPSGVVTQFTYRFLDHQGNVLTGLPAPTFSSSDAARASIIAAPVGSVQGKAPGPVTLTALGVGVPPSGITGTRPITVVAGTFTGGMTPTAVDPTDTVSLTAAAGGPGFDTDTRVDVKGVRAFTFAITATTMKFVVPATGVAGAVPVLLSNMGADQAAQNASLTSNTASLDDPFDPANDNPATSPTIATNGDYFVVMKGTCTDGAPTDPGDDCDDFFTITNAGAVPDTMTLRLDWFDGADVDILWRNAGNTAFVGNFAGATGANPEISTVVIPAATTWRLWINLFAPGDASTLVRVRLTNKN
jgi:hypothetical protein